MKTHGKEVEKIAENRYTFYQKYLAFERHKEHIYKFMYRLSEYTHYRETRQK